MAEDGIEAFIAKWQCLDRSDLSADFAVKIFSHTRGDADANRIDIHRHDLGTTSRERDCPITGAAARIKHSFAMKSDLSQAPAIKLLPALCLVSHPVVQMWEIERFQIVHPVGIGELRSAKHVEPPR